MDDLTLKTNTRETQDTATGRAQWSLAGQIDASEPNRTFPIHTSPFTIGRRPDATLSIPTSCISKNHAVIEIHGESITIRDAGSTNGTYVNGEQLTSPIELKNGDLIQFATIVFRVGQETRGETQCNTVQESSGDQALAMVQFDRLINDGGLFPHFQPIVRLEDRECIGYEVLGRSRLFGLQNPMDMFFAASQLDLEAQLSEAFRLAGVDIGSGFGKDVNLFLNTHPKELDREELYDSLRQLRRIAPEQKVHSGNP